MTTFTEPAFALPVDARGRRAPPHLAAPFVLRARLNRMARIVAECRTELTCSVSFRNLLGQSETDALAEACERLERTLMDAAPAVPCRCLHDEDCEFCEGKRWLTAKDIRRVLESHGPTASSSASSSGLLIDSSSAAGPSAESS